MLRALDQRDFLVLEGGNALVAAVEDTFEFLCSGHGSSSASARRTRAGAVTDIHPVFD
jgi:hypothetical protein